MEQGVTSVKRVEIIDYTKDVADGGGRQTICQVEDGTLRVSLDLQDNGKTLKIFVERF